MKKHYAFLILCFLSLISYRTAAQVTALDDTPPPANILSGSAILNPDGSWFSVLANDTVNGQPATFLNVSLTDLNTVPGINISPNNGMVYVQNTVAPGTYTVYYTIAQGSNTDMAAVTVTTCNQAAPTTTFVPATCSTPGMANLSGLPSGNWTLLVDPYPFYQANDGVYTVTGSGSTATIPLDPTGYQYRIRVISDTGCISPYSLVEIPWSMTLTTSVTAQYEDTNTNGIVDLGDSVVCVISMTNLSACDITDVHGQYGVILFPPLAVLPANSTMAVTGYYMLTEQDILNGMASNWEAVVGTSPLGEVYSKAFFNLVLPIPTGFHCYAFADLNGNDVMDSGEPLVPYGTFTYQQNNETPVYVQSYTGEFNLYETNPANTYTISFEPYNLCGGGFNSDTVYNNISINPNDIMDLGFPLDPSNCVDMSLSMYGNGVVPGFQSYTGILLYNDSLLTQTVSVTYTADPAVTVASVTGGDSSTISGNTASIQVTIPAMQHYWVYVYYDTPGIPTVNLGQPLQFSASVSIVPGETNTTNNTAAMVKYATGSFDPNSKDEAHGPEILYSGFTADDTLNYTLNFENTGNGNAINILITDTLDSQLDETTVRLTGSTHEVALYRHGSLLEFHFDNIMLPPSEQNTQIGKGSVQFSVKPKAGYAIGDIIPNNASIYFDTNPAIVTNTVETEFVAQLSVVDHNGQSIRIYPNPAHTNLQVSGAMIQSVRITDAGGKLVLERQVNAMQTEIPVSALSNGLYFATVQTASGAQTVKFVKQ